MTGRNSRATASSPESYIFITFFSNRLSIPALSNRYAYKHASTVDVFNCKRTNAMQTTDYSAPIPHLAVNDGEAAVKYYEKAFGAVSQAKMLADDGKRLMHAHLK